MSSEQRPESDEIHIIYNRKTGNVEIVGAQALDGAGCNLPIIKKEGPVQFEAILIWHPGCVWYRGNQYC